MKKYIRSYRSSKSFRTRAAALKTIRRARKAFGKDFVSGRVVKKGKRYYTAEKIRTF